MSKTNNILKKEIYDWIKSISFAIIIALIVKTFIFQSTIVKGESMYPTLSENDRLFINKATFLIDKPERGDIVILESPIENKIYIKRVIGLEGETIQIKNGNIYINNKVYKEEYLAEDMLTYPKEKSLWEIPKGFVFVIGDNRSNSTDSRNFGPVELNKIKGKAAIRVYPFDENFGKLQHSIN